MQTPELDDKTSKPIDRRRHGARAKLRRAFARKHGREEGFDIMRIELDRDIVIVSLICVVALLGILAALTLAQQRSIAGQQKQINRATAHITKNQQKLDDQQKQLIYLERRDRINSYQTAYRFCSRINNDRASTHWFISRLAHAQTGEARKRLLKIQHKLEARNGEPILNCDPNVVGNPATYISPAAQRRYVRRWDAGKLTAAETGICRVRIGTLNNPRDCLKK